MYIAITALSPIDEVIEVNFKIQPDEKSFFAYSTYPFQVTVGLTKFVMYPIMFLLDMGGEVNLQNDRYFWEKPFQQLETPMVRALTKHSTHVPADVLLIFQMRDWKGCA